MVEPKNTALILLEHLSKEYGDIRAVHDINLIIQKGEFVCIVGPSGAGKSTLFRLLSREELPTAGRILVASRDITALTARELPFYRRKIGVVFQDYKLINTKTVSENISFALEVCEANDQEIQVRVRKIIGLVGLEHRVDNYPHELSGGEKQRVSIARAIVHAPKILLADEPTGNLDPIHTEEIVNLLKRINESGTTVLLATHNRSVVDQLRRRVVTMKGGEIVLDHLAGRYRL